MSTRERPALVVVSGPPGCGSTALAHALAAQIACLAVCRDELEEGMVESDDMRAYALFFDVLRILVEGRVTVVAEASFDDGLWRRGLTPLLERVRLRIVQCTIDPEPPDFRRLSLEAPSLEVDASDGYRPSLEQIAWFAAA